MFIFYFSPLPQTLSHLNLAVGQHWFTCSYAHFCQKDTLMKLLIVFGTERAFPFLVPMSATAFHPPTLVVHSPTGKCMQRTAPLLHALQLQVCHAQHTHANLCVLQVPWHKPSSQEANHIKSMSHIAAYTGSEALSGVMLDIVLHPHSVTQIPQPQLCFGENLTTDLCM